MALTSAMGLASVPASVLVSVLPQAQVTVPAWAQLMALTSTMVLASVPASVLASVLP